MLLTNRPIELLCIGSFRQMQFIDFFFIGRIMRLQMICIYRFGIGVGAGTGARVDRNHYLMIMKNADESRPQVEQVVSQRKGLQIRERASKIKVYNEQEQVRRSDFQRVNVLEVM